MVWFPKRKKRLSDRKASVAKTTALSSNAVGREEARRLAIASYDQSDPFPDIPPSLLSLNEIDAYVRTTGMISPYDTEAKAGGKSPLKFASFEVPLGDEFYRFDEHGVLRVIEVGDGITVPANSIVFVVPDIDFRLPKYIAVRFNLQIRHVHRGLLLGTGPLVDPSYWGRLCVPLHNLTSEPYYIPKHSDGFLWLEFTKTTFGKTPQDLVGRPPQQEQAVRTGAMMQEAGRWKPLDFVIKAQTNIDDGRLVALRSSIPDVGDAAAKSAQSAQRAAESARKTTRNLSAGSFLALGGLLVAVFAMVGTFLQTVGAERQALRSSISELEEQVRRLQAARVDMVQEPSTSPIMEAMDPNSNDAENGVVPAAR